MGSADLPTNIRVQAAQPILWVPDVAEALDHYHRILGFDRGWSWGEPPVHGGTVLGRTRLQFSRQEETQNAEMWIEVEGLDGLFAHQSERGARIVEPIAARPWGAREYVVRDHVGTWLRFAETRWEDRPRGPLPDGLRVLERPPTSAEASALGTAIGWHGFDDVAKLRSTLEASRFGVVAVVGDEREEERTVGSALVMGDAVGNLVVRDVMVHPDFQSRGVGSALMERLNAWIEANAPVGAYVTLLAGGNRVPFYEKFGFTAGEGSGLRAMFRRVP